MATQEERAAMSDILSTTTTAVRHQMVVDDATGLFLSLNHTQPALRSLAVEQLAISIQQQQVKATQQAPFNVTANH